MGGQDLTETVAERMGVSMPQAEALKQQRGLTGDDTDPSDRVLESAVATFVNEVRGSLDYFQASQAASRIGRILVTGGGEPAGRAGREARPRPPASPSRPATRSGRWSWARPASSRNRSSSSSRWPSCLSALLSEQPDEYHHRHPHAGRSPRSTCCPREIAEEQKFRAASVRSSRSPSSQLWPAWVGSGTWPTRQVSNAEDRPRSRLKRRRPRCRSRWPSTQRCPRSTRRSRAASAALDVAMGHEVRYSFVPERPVPDHPVRRVAQHPSS